MDILQVIQQLAYKEPKTLEQMALKLTEETGEVAQAILSHGNISGNRYKNLSTQDVKEECIDVLLVASALYFKLDGSNQEELKHLIRTKQTKWEQHMDVSH